jgi:hypothetical protein
VGLFALLASRPRVSDPGAFLAAPRHPPRARGHQPRHPQAPAPAPPHHTARQLRLDPVPAAAPDPVRQLLDRHRAQAAKRAAAVLAALPGAPPVEDNTVKRIGRP